MESKIKTEEDIWYEVKSAYNPEWPMHERIIEAMNRNAQQYKSRCEELENNLRQLNSAIDAVWNDHPNSNRILDSHQKAITSIQKKSFKLLSPEKPE